MGSGKPKGPGRLGRLLGEGGASSAVIFTALQVGIQSGAVFLTYRLAVTHLGLAVLGLWSVASAAASFGRVGDLGLGGAIPRLLAGRIGTRDLATIGTLIETATLTTMIGTLILAAAFFLPLLYFARSIAPPGQEVLACNFVFGANAVLLLMAISTTLLACLDGLGKFRQRATIAISGVLLNLLILWLLIDRIGPLSLVASAVAQTVWSAVMAWALLSRYVSGLSVLPLRWSQAEFRELFAVGKYMQANSVLLMMFDPLSRVLAGRFGSVEFAALFDLAAKVTGNIRLLFSSFTQALIPFYAFIRTDRARSAALFRASTALTTTIASGLSALAIGISPFLSIFALGRLDYQFLSIFWILLLGNLINVIGGPSFSHAIGAGSLGFSTRSLAVQAFAFIMSAALLHALSVGSSVAIAYAAAVAITGVFLFRNGMRTLVTDREALLRVILGATGPVTVFQTLIIGMSWKSEAVSALISPTLLATASTLLLGDTVLRYWHRARLWVTEIMKFRIAPSKDIVSDSCNPCP